MSALISIFVLYLLGYDSESSIEYVEDMVKQGAETGAKAVEDNDDKKLQATKPKVKSGKKKVKKAQVDKND